MPRPIHFEILANDPERIGDFYHRVLGWEIATWEGGEQDYWLVTTGPDDAPGINGGIMRRHFPQAVINIIEVESLEDVLAKIEAAGGRKVNGPSEVPGVGLHAYCEDPEGNLFGVLESSPME